MTRAAVTFTEIFIVLALIFIIQTVVNLNLFEGVTEGIVEDEVPDLVTLTITGNQLLYFRFQKRIILDTGRPYERTLWLVPLIWVGATEGWGYGGKWIIDRAGRCSDYRPIDAGIVERVGTRGQLESFREALKSRFGISMHITYLDTEREHDWPLRALFSWSPTDLAESAVLRIGEFLVPGFGWDEASGEWYHTHESLRSHPRITRILYYGNRIVAQDPEELRFDPERFLARREPFWYLSTAPWSRNELAHYVGSDLRAFDEVELGADYVGFTFDRLRLGEGFSRENATTNCRFSNIVPVRESLVFLDDEG